MYFEKVEKMVKAHYDNFKNFPSVMKNMEDLFTQINTYVNHIAHMEATLPIIMNRASIEDYRDKYMQFEKTRVWLHNNCVDACITLNAFAKGYLSEPLFDLPLENREWAFDAGRGRVTDAVIDLAAEVYGTKKRDFVPTEFKAEHVLNVKSRENVIETIRLSARLMTALRKEDSKDSLPEGFEAQIKTFFSREYKQLSYNGVVVGEFNLKDGSFASTEPYESLEHCVGSIIDGTFEQDHPSGTDTQEIEGEEI